MKTGTNKLYGRALQLLARKNHSRLELRRKLIRSNPSEPVEEILDLLEKKGFLNDKIFALERALLVRERRLWGDLRVSQDLRKFGIDARMIEQVLEQVNRKNGEAEYLQKVIKVWVSKSGKPMTPHPLKKLYDRCVRLGYAPQLVRQQLAPYFDHIDWSQEDENGRRNP